jgi:RNA polymerase sigma-70 factor (ECF subfamily)
MGLHMTTPSDPHLWRRAVSGDTDAFGELYARHDRAVRAYCLWRTGDPTVAEDLTSIVFLEAWRGRARTVLATETARPLLLGIARNVVHGQWRSRRRHRAAVDRLGRATADRPNHDDDSVERLAAAERLEAVRQRLDALPHHEREVLVLVALSDLTYVEAAAVLGVAVGTIRSRLSRARAHLQDAPELAILVAEPDASATHPTPTTTTEASA